MNNVYFVGTAGSGKSTMVGAFKKWLDDNEIDSIIINLDPGAEKLPYVPDIDIREWINLEDVMSQCGLGPNGAQIAAADLMAVNIDKISSVLDTYDVDYVLIDTPGQLELFAFRESSQVVVKALGKERSLMVYLSDPTLYRSANGFVSTMTLASLVQFRMNMPIINLLSKADVLKENEIDRIIDWYNNPDSLYGCLLDEDKDPESVIGMELFRALEDTGVFGEMRSVSSETGVGLPEIYAAVQLQFHGGDDSGKDY
jgi:GTPase SAR1 family protein